LEFARNNNEWRDRPALGIDAALAEIEKNKGIFYDSTVADACMRLFREKGYKMLA